MATWVLCVVLTMWPSYHKSPSVSGFTIQGFATEKACEKVGEQLKKRYRSESQMADAYCVSTEQ